MSCVVQCVADAVGWMEPAAQSNRRYVCRHVNVTLHQESTNCCARLLLPLTPNTELKELIYRQLIRSSLLWATGKAACRSPFVQDRR